MRLFYQPDPDTPYGEPGSVLHNMSAALHSSVDRVLSLLISILPGLLALVIAVVLLTAIGVGLSWVLRKGLTAARFDERLATNKQDNTAGIADWAPRHSPTLLVGRVAFWSCVLLGLIVGVSAFDAAYATGSALSVSLLPFLTRGIGAILLLFAGNLIARFLARTVLIGAVNNKLQYARFLSMGVKWLVLVLTAAMVLDHLRIGGTVVELAFGILFGGIVLTLALAIGLGSRDLVTRSLERQTERSERPLEPAQPPTTLRHF